MKSGPSLITNLQSVELSTTQICHELSLSIRHVVVRQEGILEPSIVSLEYL